MAGAPAGISDQEVILRTATRQGAWAPDTMSHAEGVGEGWCFQSLGHRVRPCRRREGEAPSPRPRSQWPNEELTGSYQATQNTVHSLIHSFIYSGTVYWAPTMYREKGQGANRYRRESGIQPGAAHRTWKHPSLPSLSQRSHTCPHTPSFWSPNISNDERGHRA